MSQPVAAALAPLPFELVYDDGEPLETEWDTYELPLLREVIGQAMAEQGRIDFYAGMNMFVYYSVEQAREVAEEEAYGGRRSLSSRVRKGRDHARLSSRNDDDGHASPRRWPWWRQWSGEGGSGASSRSRSGLEA